MRPRSPHSDLEGGMMCVPKIEKDPHFTDIQVGIWPPFPEILQPFSLRISYLWELNITLFSLDNLFSWWRCSIIRILVIIRVHIGLIPICFWQKKLPFPWPRPPFLWHLSLRPPISLTFAFETPHFPVQGWHEKMTPLFPVEGTHIIPSSRSECGDREGPV